MSKGPTLFIMRFRISIPAEAGISCSHPSHCHSSEGWNLLSLTPIKETSHASPKQILMQIGNLPNIPRTFLIFLDARTSKITFFGGWNLLFSHCHSSEGWNLQNNFFSEAGNFPCISQTNSHANREPPQYPKKHFLLFSEAGTFKILPLLFAPQYKLHCLHPCFLKNLLMFFGVRFAPPSSDLVSNIPGYTFLMKYILYTRFLSNL
jgi:hypothetical protein